MANFGSVIKAQEPVEEAKCPNCGAPLVYNAEKGTLMCDHCGTKVDLGYWKDHEISGFNFKDIESHAMQENADDIPIYNCVSCGAEILAAKEEVSLTCPYCSNNIVLTEKVSGKLRPHAIVPFKIAKKELAGALNKFYKDKVLLPKNFFTDSKVEKVTGVYVPFWIFNGELKGDLSYTGEIRSVHRTHDYETTSISDYKLLRNASVSFKDLPIDASAKLDDALMDSVMPFDLSALEPFNTGYLAGFAADRFDVSSGAMSARAEERMKKTAYNVVHGMAGKGFSNVRFRGGQMNADIRDVRYVLLPVYTFNIKHDGRKYSFAMNGQTGKVVGAVPTDKAVSREYMLKRLLTVFGGFLLLSIIAYFAGL